MVKAQKLKSGSYRCFVFSHKDETGKKHYKSLTAPTKAEAEYMAAEFIRERKRLKDSNNCTLGEAVDRYIDLKRPVLSPSSIYRYEKIRKTAFQGIMDIRLDSITSNTLQEAIRSEEHTSELQSR